MLKYKNTNLIPLFIVVIKLLIVKELPSIFTSIPFLCPSVSNAGRYLSNEEILKYGDEYLSSSFFELVTLLDYRLILYQFPLKVYILQFIWSIR